MSRAGDPSINLLAQAGLITSESGRVFEPSFGRLELPWLLDVSREAARAARARFKDTKTVDDETRYGWFIASTEAEFKGLKLLLEQDWRRALKAWKGGRQSDVHNRATLHRALFFSPRSERPDAHIRECLRLYHHLSELEPNQHYYRTLQEQLIEHLTNSVKEAHESGDDESAARSLKVLAKTVGLVAVSHLQNQFFGKELLTLRRSAARIQSELLAFQGMAHAPPRPMLDNFAQELSEDIIPKAARFSHKLIEGSQERTEVEEVVAKTCGVLSQSFVKAGDNRAGKKWIGEALRWEPSAVEEWRELPQEDFGEDDAAEVLLPEKAEHETTDAPSPRGSKALGVQTALQSQNPGDPREEWLESVYLGFIPVFPLKRFAAYRNLESLEIGYYLRIPMNTLDHLRQGVFVLLLSFLVTVGGLTISQSFKDQDRIREQEQAIATEIEETVETLKILAQKEAKLQELDKPTSEQQKKLKKLQEKRLELIRKLENLEQK